MEPPSSAEELTSSLYLQLVLNSGVEEEEQEIRGKVHQVGFRQTLVRPVFAVTILGRDLINRALSPNHRQRTVHIRRLEIVPGKKKELKVCVCFRFLIFTIIRLASWGKSRP